MGRTPCAAMVAALIPIASSGYYWGLGDYSRREWQVGTPPGTNLQAINAAH